MLRSPRVATGGIRRRGRLARRNEAMLGGAKEVARPRPYGTSCRRYVLPGCRER